MRIKRIAYLVSALMVIALLIGACQAGAGEAPATQKAATEASSAAPTETEAPAETAAPPTEAAQSVNEVLTAAMSELTGLVEMKQANENAFYNASPDSVLQVDGQVQTGNDGKARLDLSSGTIVRVSPSSLFTLISNQEEQGGLFTKAKLEIGRIFVILSGGSMDVETPSGVASVRGSYLKIQYDPEGETLELTCLEGNCSVTTPDGKTINFTDGQKVVIHKDPETGEWVVDEGPMNADDFNEWLENNPEAQALVEAGLAGLGGTSTGGSCMALLQPTNGSDFFTFGGVDFEWESQPGAASYILTFTYPSGIVVQFSTTDTNMTRFIESMPAGGQYTWDVTALDGSGTPICTTESETFTKADTTQWLEQQKEKKQQPPACDPCNEAASCYDYSACMGLQYGY